MLGFYLILLEQTDCAQAVAIALCLRVEPCCSIAVERVLAEVAIQRVEIWITQEHSSFNRRQHEGLVVAFRMFERGCIYLVKVLYSNRFTLA